MQRAFRYQTGELEEIVDDLKNTGSVEVDVVAQDRVQPFLKDLENYGIYENKDKGWEHEAISFFDNQEFLFRIYVIDRASEQDNLYIDFFTDYEEDTYDPIFWG